MLPYAGAHPGTVVIMDLYTNTTSPTVERPRRAQYLTSSAIAHFIVCIRFVYYYLAGGVPPQALILKLILIIILGHNILNAQLVHGPLDLILRLVQRIVAFFFVRFQFRGVR